MRDNAWLTYTEEDEEKIIALADRYKDFLTKQKTERECAAYFGREAEKAGYIELSKVIDQKMDLKPGDKVYHIGMGKTGALFEIGRRPLTDGMNILCAHIDSPRLDI